MATLRKIRGRFYLVEKRWSAAKGKWVQVSLGPCGTKKDSAVRVANAYAERKRLRKHGIVDPGRCVLTLAELRDLDLQNAAQRGLVLYHRESAWRNILVHLEPAMRLEDFTAAVGDRLTTALLRTAGPKTVENYRTVLRSALKFAARVHEFSGDSSRLLQRLKVPRGREGVALTDALAYRLCELAAVKYKRVAKGVELMLLTASRVSEVLGLTSSSIRDSLLHFPAMKGGYPRSFRVEGRLGVLVEVLPLTWSWREWRSLRDEVGLSHIRRHDLRHTAATLAFRRGATIYDVQRLLGHRTPEMAMRIYTHLFPTPLDPVTIQEQASLAPPVDLVHA